MDWGSGLCGVEVHRQNLIDGEVLRGQDAVESFERKGAFAVEEIGDMGLLKACLLGEPTACKYAAFDASKEFDAKEFVEVLKIHGRGMSMANHII